MEHKEGAVDPHFTEGPTLCREITKTTSWLMERKGRIEELGVLGE